MAFSDEEKLEIKGLFKDSFLEALDARDAKIAESRAKQEADEKARQNDKPDTQPAKKSLGERLFGSLS